MEIPKVSQGDILRALQYIDENGIPDKNKSVRYFLIGEGGKTYSERKELPKIDERMIKDVIQEVGMKVKETFITEFIMSSYRAMGWNKSKTVD